MKVLLQLGEDFSKVFAVLDPRFFLGQVAGDLEAKAGDLKGQEGLQVHLNRPETANMPIKSGSDVASMK